MVDAGDFEDVKPKKQQRVAKPKPKPKPKPNPKPNPKVRAKSDRLEWALREAGIGERVRATDISYRTGIETVAELDRAMRKLGRRGVDVRKTVITHTGEVLYWIADNPAMSAVDDKPQSQSVETVPVEVSAVQDKAVTDADIDRRIRERLAAGETLADITGASVMPLPTSDLGIVGRTWERVRNRLGRAWQWFMGGA